MSRNYSTSLWAAGAAAARQGLDYAQALFLVGLTPGQFDHGHRNGYEFARAQIIKERAKETRRVRFFVEREDSPEGYLPGSYYFVRDLTTGLKVSRYSRQARTAHYKRRTYEAKEQQQPGVPFPEVGREAELYQSRYAVPTAGEWFDVSMYISKGVAQGRRLDADVQQYLSQAKRWKRRHEHEANQQTGGTFRSTFQPTVVAAPVRPAVVKDTGDVRPQSVGDFYPYIVVAVENPTGLPEGRYWYVQSPKGFRSSGYTTSAEQVLYWAAYHKLYKDTRLDYVDTEVKHKLRVNPTEDDLQWLRDEYAKDTA